MSISSYVAIYSERHSRSSVTSWHDIRDKTVQIATRATIAFPHNGLNVNFSSKRVVYPSAVPLFRSVIRFRLSPMMRFHRTKNFSSYRSYVFTLETLKEQAKVSRFDPFRFRRVGTTVISTNQSNELISLFSNHYNLCSE